MGESQGPASVQVNYKHTERWEPAQVAIPVSMLKAQIPPIALRLWLALAVFANSEGVCWPSTGRLVQLLPPGTDERSVRRAKRELEKEGLLVTTPRFNNGRQTSSLYELRYPQKEGDETVRVGSDQTARHEGDQTARQNLLNKNLEKRKTTNSRQEAFTAWGEVSAHIRAVGRIGGQKEWNDPRTGKAISEMGGWYEVCRATEKQAKWDFVAAWA